MKSHLKVIANIFLTSISLSILLGSFLKVVGPINQSHNINKKLNLAGKSSSSAKKELQTRKSNFLSFYNNFVYEVDFVAIPPFSLQCKADSAILPLFCYLMQIFFLCCSFRPPFFNFFWFVPCIFIALQTILLYENDFVANLPFVLQYNANSANTLPLLCYLRQMFLLCCSFQPPFFIFFCHVLCIFICYMKPILLPFCSSFCNIM